jgi:hypothetical protein
MSAFARKTPLVVIAIGVGLLFASLRFAVGRSATAAPQAQMVAPAPAPAEKNGEPISNEVGVFQQLD